MCDPDARARSAPWCFQGGTGNSGNEMLFYVITSLLVVAIPAHSPRTCLFDTVMASNCLEVIFSVCHSLDSFTCQNESIAGL